MAFGRAARDLGTSENQKPLKPPFGADGSNGPGFGAKGGAMKKKGNEKKKKKGGNPFAKKKK
jgi:hypothetical protein